MSRVEIIEKAERIGSVICKFEDVSRFWQARDKMGRNKHAQTLFEALKLKTNNKIGLEQTVGTDHPKHRELEAEIHEIELQLQEIPVAMQYKEAQAEINELLQGVMNQLMNRLGENIRVEPGPRLGCGHGPDGNGCHCGGH